MISCAFVADIDEAKKHFAADKTDPYCSELYGDCGEREVVVAALAGFRKDEYTVEQGFYIAVAATCDEAVWAVANNYRHGTDDSTTVLGDLIVTVKSADVVDAVEKAIEQATRLVLQ